MNTTLLRKKGLKRVLCLFLAVLLMLSSLPLSVIAGFGNKVRAEGTKYTVTFYKEAYMDDTANYTVSETMEVDQDGAITVPEDLAVTAPAGYEFDGWRLARGNENFDFGTKITADFYNTWKNDDTIKLYAHFEEVKKANDPLNNSGSIASATESFNGNLTSVTSMISAEMTDSNHDGTSTWLEFGESSDAATFSRKSISGNQLLNVHLSDVPANAENIAVNVTFDKTLSWQSYGETIDQVKNSLSGSLQYTKLPSDWDDYIGGKILGVTYPLKTGTTTLTIPIQFSLDDKYLANDMDISDLIKVELSYDGTVQNTVSKNAKITDVIESATYFGGTTVNTRVLKGQEYSKAPGDARDIFHYLNDNHVRVNYTSVEATIIAPSNLEIKNIGQTDNRPTTWTMTEGETKDNLTTYTFSGSRVGMNLDRLVIPWSVVIPSDDTYQVGETVTIIQKNVRMKTYSGTELSLDEEHKTNLTIADNEEKVYVQYANTESAQSYFDGRGSDGVKGGYTISGQITNIVSPYIHGEIHNLLTLGNIGGRDSGSKTVTILFDKDSIGVLSVNLPVPAGQKAKNVQYTLDGEQWIDAKTQPTDTGVVKMSFADFGLTRNQLVDGDDDIVGVRYNLDSIPALSHSRGSVAGYIKEAGSNKALWTISLADQETPGNVIQSDWIYANFNNSNIGFASSNAVINVNGKKINGYGTPISAGSRLNITTPFKAVAAGGAITPAFWIRVPDGVALEGIKLYKGTGAGKTMLNTQDIEASYLYTDEADNAKIYRLTYDSDNIEEMSGNFFTDNGDLANGLGSMWSIEVDIKLSEYLKSQTLKFSDMFWAENVDADYKQGNDNYDFKANTKSLDIDPGYLQQQGLGSLNIKAITSIMVANDASIDNGSTWTNYDSAEVDYLKQNDTIQYRTLITNTTGNTTGKGTTAYYVIPKKAQNWGELNASSTDNSFQWSAILTEAVVNPNEEVFDISYAKLDPSSYGTSNAAYDAFKNSEFKPWNEAEKEDYNVVRISAKENVPWISDSVQANQFGFIANLEVVEIGDGSNELLNVWSGVYENKGMTSDSIAFGSVGASGAVGFSTNHGEITGSLWHDRVIANGLIDNGEQIIKEDGWQVSAYKTGNDTLPIATVDVDATTGTYKFTNLVLAEGAYKLTVENKWHDKGYRFTIVPEGAEANKFSQAEDNSRLGVAAGATSSEGGSVYNIGITADEIKTTFKVSTVEYDAAGNYVGIKAANDGGTFDYALDSSQESDLTEKAFERIGNTNVPIGSFTPKAKAGYEFKGWFEEDNSGQDPAKQVEEGALPGKVEKETTYYAVFAPIVHTVSFDQGDHGTIENNPAKVMVTHGSTVQVVPTATSDPVDAYTFVAWKSSADDSTMTAEEVLKKTVTEDVTYVAQWKRAECKVTFKSGENGSIIGSDPLVVSVYKFSTWGENFGAGKTAIPTPKADAGYYFAGWQTDEGQPVDFTAKSDDVIGSDQTYVAHFEKQNRLEIIGNSGTKTYNGEEQEVEGFTYVVKDADGNALATQPILSLKGSADQALTAIISGTEAKTYTDTLFNIKGDNLRIYLDNMEITDQFSDISYTDGELKIDPATLTITSKGGGIHIFDGTPKVAASGGSGEGFDRSGTIYGNDTPLAGITAKGISEVFPGTYDNEFEMGNQPKISDDTYASEDHNYTIKLVKGSLVIENPETPLSFTITGNTLTKEYTGSDLSIDNFDGTSSTIKVSGLPTGFSLKEESVQVTNPVEKNVNADEAGTESTVYNQVIDVSNFVIMYDGLEVPDQSALFAAPAVEAGTLVPGWLMITPQTVKVTMALSTNTVYKGDEKPTVTPLYDKFKTDADITAALIDGTKSTEIWTPEFNGNTLGAYEVGLSQTDQAKYGNYIFDYTNAVVQTVNVFEGGRVFYHNNGVDAEVPEDPKVYDPNDKAQVKFPATPKAGCEHFTFLGWSTDPKATTPDYTKAGDEVTFSNFDKAEAINLYAVWEVDWDKIPFELNDTTVTYDGKSHTATWAGKVPTTVKYIDDKGEEKDTNPEYIDVKRSFIGRQVEAYKVTAVVTIEAGGNTFTSPAGSKAPENLKALVTINPLALSVKANDITINRGDAAPTAFSYAWTNGQAPEARDNITVNDQYTIDPAYRADSLDPMTYDIVMNGTTFNGTTGNYELTTEPGILTLNPMEINLEALATLADGSKTYGENDPELSGLFAWNSNLPTGFNPDHFKVQVTREAGEAAKGYQLTARIALDTNYQNYYKVNGDSIDANFVINPALLTIVPNEQKVTYTDEVPNLDGAYTLKGLIANPDLNIDDVTNPPVLETVSLTTDYTKGAWVGDNYKITVDNLKDIVVNPANYTLAAEEGKLSVAPYLVKIQFQPGTNGTLVGATEKNDVWLDTTWGDNIGEGAGKLAIPTPKPNEGYEFTGWDISIPEDDSKVKGDMTFVAQWKLIDYIVTFDQGDHGTIENNPVRETVAHGNKVQAVPTATPNPTDEYTFLGWRSSADDRVLAAEEILNKPVTADVTYTAQYEAIVVPPAPTTPEPTPPTPTPPTPTPTPGIVTVTPATPGDDLVITSTITSFIDTLLTPITAPITAGNVVAPTTAADNASLDRVVNDEVPLGNRSINGWSLLSLIMGILSIILGTITLVTAFGKRDKTEEETEAYVIDEFGNMTEESEALRAEREAEKEKAFRRSRLLKVLAFLTGLLPMIVFLVLDNLSLPMIWINRYTPTVALFFILNMLVMAIQVLYQRKQSEDTEEDASDDDIAKA